LYNLLHALDHALHFRCAQIGIDRQREAARIGVFSVRKVVLAIPVGSGVVGVQVQGNKVYAGADAGSLEFLNELFAIDREGLVP
jgi:hypothetical protein